MDTGFWLAIDRYYLLDLNESKGEKISLAELNSKEKILLDSNQISFSKENKKPWFQAKTDVEYWYKEAKRILLHREALRRSSEFDEEFCLVLETGGKLAFHTQGNLLMQRVMYADRQDWGIIYPSFHHEGGAGRCFAREGNSSLWKLGKVSKISGYLMPDWARKQIFNKFPTPEGIWEWLAEYHSLEEFFSVMFPMETGLFALALEIDGRKLPKKKLRLCKLTQKISQFKRKMRLNKCRRFGLGN